MITARVGETVSLSLPETPSTGYQWQLTSTLPVVADEFFPSSTIPGSVGERVFTLEVTTPGRHDLLAALTRPRETVVRDVRTFVVDAH